MTTSQRQRSRPVVVVDARRPSTMASTPITPTSPRGVHFLPNGSPVSGISRPLTTTEAWSLYYFETHAAQCRYCYDPSAAFDSGRGLCPRGHPLAVDAMRHIIMRQGVIYSAIKEDNKRIRVEVSEGYTRTRSLLRTVERRAHAATSRGRSASTSRTPQQTRHDSAMGRADKTADSPRRYSDSQRAHAVTMVFDPRAFDRRSASRERHRSADLERARTLLFRNDGRRRQDYTGDTLLRDERRRYVNEGIRATEEAERRGRRR